MKSERSENAAIRVLLQIKSEKRTKLRKPRNEASYGISEFFRGLRHERLQSSLPFLLVLRRNLKELEGGREKERVRKKQKLLAQLVNFCAAIYLLPFTCARVTRDICVFPQKHEF